jgi:hypothetical protein
VPVRWKRPLDRGTIGPFCGKERNQKISLRLPERFQKLPLSAPSWISRTVNWKVKHGEILCMSFLVLGTPRYRQQRGSAPGGEWRARNGREHSRVAVNGVRSDGLRLRVCCV